LRPNAWITPLGNWGQGQIKLVEIPSPKEINDNIVAYWIPKNLPAMGQPIDLAYRIHFQSEEAIDSASGRVTATRIGIGDKEDLRRFVLDFEGGKLKNLPVNAPVKPVISVEPDGELVQQNSSKNPVTGGWRVAFQVKTPKDKPLQLRAFLQYEKNPATKEALSETWNYELQP
jgi:glucans biosynthesis protein